MGALWDQVDITCMFYMGSRWATLLVSFFFPLSFTSSFFGGLRMLSECLMSFIQTFVGRTSVISTLYDQGRSNNEAYT